MSAAGETRSQPAGGSSRSGPAALSSFRLRSAAHRDRLFGWRRKHPRTGCITGVPMRPRSPSVTTAGPIHMTRTSVRGHIGHRKRWPTSLPLAGPRRHRCSTPVVAQDWSDGRCALAGFEGAIYGIDLSTRSLRVAERTGDYDTLQAGDLQEPLDVADDSVDVLLCVGVMTYVPDVETAWRDFARVVRPGGLVVVTQREDLWETRDCRGAVDRLSADGVWTPTRGDRPRIVPSRQHRRNGSCRRLLRDRRGLVVGFARY